MYKFVLLMIGLVGMLHAQVESTPVERHGRLEVKEVDGSAKVVVDAATELGLYVIIDWHSHHAEDYEQSAITFFEEMATTYKDHDNMIFEIYNEPLQVDWSTTCIISDQRPPYLFTKNDPVDYIDGAIKNR